MTEPTDDAVIRATRNWLEKAVIGLNLCPFAKAVHVKEQVRYRVCHPKHLDPLLDELDRELLHLAAADPAVLDTTLLIVPGGLLADFLDFNDFLEVADGVLAEHGLEGQLQIASFHPQFQFADTEPDDITNYTNRAPYPTLHLLREASIDRAVAAFPDAAAIFETNMATLQRLGHSGWEALGVGQPDSRADD